MSGATPKQFRVQKDNGEWWIMTFGGDRKGVRWDREDPTAQHETPDESHRYNASAPGDNQFAKAWSEYVAERLMQALEDMLEEARPYIEEWLRSTALPWLQRTARTAWTRIRTQKKPRQPVQFAPTEEVRITDVAPANAIVLAERTNERAQAPSSLTPEEAQKQLDDIDLLTRILAAKVRELTNSEIKERGESDERFLERREQAEQVAVRNVTSNIRGMLEQGTDLGQAIALTATYTPAFVAGRVEAGPLSIESDPQFQQKPRSIRAQALEP